MKKRLLALMLVMAMVLGMSMTVFAAEPAENTNKGKLVKTYKAMNDGAAPAETFEFEFTEDDSKTVNNEGKPFANIDSVVYPLIDGDNKVEIAFTSIEGGQEETKVADLNITLPEGVQLGKYYYEVAETDKGTAGITYNVDGDGLYLVVTVTRKNVEGSEEMEITPAVHYEKITGKKVDDGKIGEIINEYKSGSLEVSKTITGNSADMTKQFPFTIVLTAPSNKTVTTATNITYSTNDSDTQKIENGTVTFVNGTATINVNLGHGEKLNINNLPEGVTYTVVEDAGEYKQTVNAEAQTDIDESEAGINLQASGTIAGGENDTVSYENNLNKEVDTGIFTNNMPYILALVAIAAVAIVMFRRKREF